MTSNTCHRIRTGAAAVLALAIIAGLPGVAMAQSSDAGTTRSRDTTRTFDMEAAKARALQAIDTRLAALDAAVSRLATARYLTAEHEARLTRDLQAVSASLRALRAQIQAEDDPQQLKNLMRQIVEGHYVFAFQLPRVRLVTGSDATVGVSLRLRGLGDRLEVKILEAEQRGNDMTEARRLLEDLRGHAAAAHGIGVKAAAEVLALTVDGYPDNKPVLDRARTALRVGRDHLDKGRQDARAIIAILNGSRPSR